MVDKLVEALLGSIGVKGCCEQCWRRASERRGECAKCLDARLLIASLSELEETQARTAEQERADVVAFVLWQDWRRRGPIELIRAIERGEHVGGAKPKESRHERS